MIEDGHIIVTMCGRGGTWVKTLSGKVSGFNGEDGQNTIEGHSDGNAQKICANKLSYTMLYFKQTISIDTRMIGNLCCLTFD